MYFVISIGPTAYDAYVNMAEFGLGRCSVEFESSLNGLIAVINSIYPTTWL